MLKTLGGTAGDAEDFAEDTEKNLVRTSLLNMNSGTNLRIARPTDQLEEVVRFYSAGVGLEILGSFEDHDGFDGVTLGLAGMPYHFEFTRKSGTVAGRAPTLENLLVFYFPEMNDWNAAMERMTDAGYRAVTSFNPYWDRHGRTFEDPDGYRVVLQHGSWPNTNRD